MTLQEKLPKKSQEKTFSQNIEKYFGSMRGEIGSMEEIDANIKRDRTPRKERDPMYLHLYQ